MAETIQQLQTRLTNVRAAIDRALQAQSYSVGGRQITHANINSLMKLEKDLQRKLSRLQGRTLVASDFSNTDADLVSGRF